MDKRDLLGRFKRQDNPEARRNTVCFKLTDAELAALDEFASQQGGGINRSGVVRQLVLRAIGIRQA